MRKIYIFATMARSFDTNSIRTGSPHLIFSTFYTYVPQTESLLNFKLDRTLIIIISSSSEDTDISYAVSPETNIPSFFLIKIPIKILLGSFISGVFLRDNFFYSVIGSSFLTTKSEYNLFSNVLFRFDDLNWKQIQNLFTILKINISGGSNTTRELLHIADFNLSSYLLYMNYNRLDVCESFKLARISRKTKTKLIKGLNLAELYSPMSLSNIKIECERYLVEISNHLEKVLFYIKNFEIIIQNKEPILAKIGHMLEEQFNKECEGAILSIEAYKEKQIEFKYIEEELNILRENIIKCLNLLEE